MVPEAQDITTVGSLGEMRAAAEARLLGLEPALPHPHPGTPMFHGEEKCEGMGGGDGLWLAQGWMCVRQKHSRG